MRAAVRSLLLGVVAGSLVCATLVTAPPASALRESAVSDGESAAQVAFDGAVADPAPLPPVSLPASLAISWAEQRTRFPVRACLLFVRVAFGIPKKYYSAHTAWLAAKHRHRTAIADIPAGVPVFTQGRSWAGHIAVSLGGGWVRSTDWPSYGKVGTVRLTTLLATWRQHYLGWTEDLNDVLVVGVGARPSLAGGVVRLRSDLE